MEKCATIRKRKTENKQKDVHSIKLLKIINKNNMFKHSYIFNLKPGVVFMQIT